MSDMGSVCVSHTSNSYFTRAVSHMGDVSHMGRVSHKGGVSRMGSVSHKGSVSHMGSVCLTWAVCVSQGQCVSHKGSACLTRAECLTCAVRVSQGQSVSHGQCVTGAVDCVSQTKAMVTVKMLLTAFLSFKRKLKVLSIHKTAMGPSLYASVWIQSRHKDRIQSRHMESTKNGDGERYALRRF